MTAPQLSATAIAPTLVKALRALRRGDVSVRQPQDWSGEPGEVADLFDETVGLQAALTGELQHLAKTVGRDGQIGARAELPGAVGGWQTAAQAINGLVADVVHPVTEVGRLLESVARGDLSVSMEFDGRRATDARRSSAHGWSGPLGPDRDQAAVLTPLCRAW